jgi:hypothetical protein
MLIAKKANRQSPEKFGSVLQAEPVFVLNLVREVGLVVVT